MCPERPKKAVEAICLTIRVLGIFLDAFSAEESITT